MPTSLQQEIGKKNPFEVAEQEAYLNVHRTASCLGAPFEKLFREHGLTQATYNALRIVRGHGEKGVPSQTIGRELVAQVPDITRLVDRLVEGGLAERCRTTVDRRVVLVKITQPGMDLLKRLDEPVVQLHRDTLAHLTLDELNELNRLLVKARQSPVVAHAHAES